MATNTVFDQLRKLIPQTGEMKNKALPQMD
jgi:hypothetical protein